MSGTKVTNWQDFYATTLDGEGFTNALNKTVKRRDVPPGMIFKFQEGKKFYASLGFLPIHLAGRHSIRVSLELLAPVFRAPDSHHTIRYDAYKQSAVLNVSTNQGAEDSNAIVKGAFSLVCIPYSTDEKTTEELGRVKIGPLTHGIAANLGTLIRLPKDKHVYMMLGYAPEMPENQALVMRLTTDEKDVGQSTAHNIFLHVVDFGTTIAEVGMTKLTYWLSNK